MKRNTARYWRQVRAVERMTGTSSAIARRAVAALRSARDWTTAAETARHPRIVARTVRELEKDTAPEMPYTDLGDFLSTYDEWEGDYDYYDVETNADY